MVRKRFQLHNKDIAIIVIAAVVAALALFARPPEYIKVTSADGVVTITGELPRSYGEIRILRDDAARAEFAEDDMRAVYRLEPVGVLLPQPVTLSFSLAEINEVEKEALVLALWNDAKEQWELVPSTFDPRTNTINASIQTFGYWTLRSR